MIFSTLFLLFLHEMQTVTIQTQVFEEDVGQISKVWFHMENQHPSY